MGKKDIVSATEVKSGKLAILVDTEYIDSFREHLEKLGVSLDYPEGAIFTSKAFDDRGKVTSYRVAVFNIHAQGTLNEFEKWLASWKPVGIFKK